MLIQTGIIDNIEAALYPAFRMKRAEPAHIGGPLADQRAVPNARSLGIGRYTRGCSTIRYNSRFFRLSFEG